MDSAGKRYWEDNVHFNSSPGPSSDEQIKNLYDDLATNYVKISEDAGFKAHEQCPEIFNRTLEKLHGDSKKNLKILDAGAGTGMTGLNLKKMGYTNIDALDISPKMLAEAEKTNVYTKLICAPLCEEPITEIATGTYDAAIAVACITAGHIRPPALEEIVRHVKPGGIICFTIRKDIYDNGEEWGYKTKMEDLQRVGKWEPVSQELIQYYENVSELREKCYCFAFKVIKSQ